MSTWREDLRALKQELPFKESSLFLLVGFLLILQHYFARYTVLARLLKSYVEPAELEMWASLSWCGLIIVLYALIPSLWIKWVYRERLRDYGWSMRGLGKHWKPYVLFFLLMLGPLLFAATTPAFKNTYPFFDYVKTSWTLFALWQAAYALQFVAVEFFFRGFITFGLYPRFGSFAFFISMIPYAMIHFPKPLGESLGAMIAGLVLGYLAYKNKSIWGGAILHWLIAFSMDLGALVL